MIEKCCIGPSCKRYPCFGSAVPGQTLWACGAHRALLEAETVPRAQPEHPPPQGRLL